MRASNGEMSQLAKVMCKSCRFDRWGYTIEEAIFKWNDRAGDREPETSKTTGVSTLASAMCYAAWIDEAKRILSMLGWKKAALDTLDAAAWKEYYTEGKTPAQAVREEY